MKNVGQLQDLTFVKTKVKDKKELSELARQHPATHNPVTCGDLDCCLLEGNLHYRPEGPVRRWPSFSTKAPVRAILF